MQSDYQRHQPWKSLPQDEAKICFPLIVWKSESDSCSVVSDSWLHWPAKLLCPWNSPGKNTGVGCHSLLQGIFPTRGSNLGLRHCKQILSLSEPPRMPLTSMCARSVTSVKYDSLWLYGQQPTRLFSPWNSLGKNTGAGCHALLQGIFPTQGSNPRFLHLLHCQWIRYCWATREAPN